MTSVIWQITLGGDGSTTTDGTDPNGLFGPTGYGYKTRLLTAFSNFLNIAAQTQTLAAAATNAGNVNGTSASSVLIGTGSKAFTYAQSNRTVAKGMWLQVSSAANPANFVNGQVTDWVDPIVTLSVPTDGTGGSGTFGDWVISLSGRPGASAGGDVTQTGTQTLTNKTLTAPRIGTSILDTNGNELFLLTATASAVNELTYANAATGNAPTFTASGGDTNISINLVPKGTGTVNAAGVPVVTTTGTQTLTNKTLTAASLGGTTAVTGLLDASAAGAGQIKFPATRNPSADANTLDDYQEGSFTATGTGFSGSVTATWSYIIIGNAILVSMGQTSGTSNTTAFTVTGMPAEARPASTKQFPVHIQDNSSYATGVAQLSSGGTLTVFPNPSFGAWTASGTKTLSIGTLPYPLN